MMMVTTSLRSLDQHAKSNQICSDDPGKPVPLAKLNFILFSLLIPPHLDYKSCPMLLPKDPRIQQHP